MIKIEHTYVVGWEPAIRGMRNPKNSWHLSDSGWYINWNRCDDTGYQFKIGPNDHKLMMQLRGGGTDDRKFMRMIAVYLDITAPLYWWKEFDTYKVGTVANSCSTMHKIHERDLKLEDFSCEKLIDTVDDLDICIQDASDGGYTTPRDILDFTVEGLNIYRAKFIETKDKKYWHQMIQLLPTSYNQRRTIMLNYEVLANMHKSRKTHKLDEWREFCKWIESLPYSELITGEVKSDA